METFGDRVREARKKRGMTQKQLAAASGLSQTTISDIERGRNASSADIVALARAVGVSAEWLADGRGPRTLLTPDLPPAEGVNAAALATAQVGHEGGTLLTGLSPAPDRKGRVPLISNVQAGHWTHAWSAFVFARTADSFELFGFDFYRWRDDYLLLNWLLPPFVVLAAAFAYRWIKRAE